MSDQPKRYQVVAVYDCPDCGGGERGCSTCGFGGEVMAQLPADAPALSLIEWNTDQEAAPLNVDVLLFLKTSGQPVLTTGYRTSPFDWKLASGWYEPASVVLAWALLPEFKQAEA